MFASYRKLPGYEEISDAEVDDVRVLHLRQTATGKQFHVVVKLGKGRTQVSLVAPLH